MSGIVEFNESECDRNPFCPAARACPEGALHMDPVRRTPRFSVERCIGCGACLEACPRGAVRSA